jgi:hypothetical protein
MGTMALADLLVSIGTAHLPPPVLTWWQQQDSHVCHGLAAGDPSERNIDKLEIRDKGTDVLISARILLVFFALTLANGFASNTVRNRFTTLILALQRESRK